MQCFCNSNICLYNDLNCSCKCSFQLDPFWHRWEVLCFRVPGRKDGGSGTGEYHPAATRAWMYGHKMPPACCQEWLPSENTFLITSLAWGRLLWRQNHRSCRIIPCLYTALLSPGKQICHKAEALQHLACPAAPSVFPFPGKCTHMARSHGWTAVQGGAPQRTQICVLQVPVPVIIGHRKVSKAYRLCSLWRSF